MARIWEIMSGNRDVGERRGRSTYRNMRDEDMEEELEKAFEEGRKQGWREAMEEYERKQSGHRKGGYSSYRRYDDYED